jgi:hypothetical protein
VRPTCGHVEFPFGNSQCSRQNCDGPAPRGVVTAFEVPDRIGRKSRTLRAGAVDSILRRAVHPAIRGRSHQETSLQRHAPRLAGAPRCASYARSRRHGSRRSSDTARVLADCGIHGTAHSTRPHIFGCARNRPRDSSSPQSTQALRPSGRHGFAPGLFPNGAIVVRDAFVRAGHRHRQFACT